MEATKPNGECLTVTVAEAGRLFGLSRGGAYAAANRGDLPGVIRIGRRILISKAAMARALENGWRPGAPERN